MPVQAEFQFESASWQRVLRSLKSKWTAIEERKKFADLISPIVFADIMEHFRKESGPSGRWQSWSKAYSEHMASIGKGGNKILQDSGRLRMSFTPTSWKAQSDGILFFNNAKTKSGFPYAAAHDEGGKKLPKRKFMWFSSSGMNKMVSVVERWLADGDET